MQRLLAGLAGSILGVLPALLCAQGKVSPDMLNSLGSEEYRVRVQAEHSLTQWAMENLGSSLGALLEAHDAAADPEVAFRLRSVLKRAVVAEKQKDAPGYVGVQMNEIEVAMPESEETRFGVLISEVHPGTPAERAGLRKGDIIVKFGKSSWKEAGAVNAFAEEVKARRAGDEVDLEVLSGKELKTVRVKLGPRPMGLPENRGLIFPGGAGGFGLMAPFDTTGELKKMIESAEDQYFEEWLKAQRAGQRPR